MDSPAANRIPDELISEILSPLLKHSDKVFSELGLPPVTVSTVLRHPCHGCRARPVKDFLVSFTALLEPGYSSSTYLLVCKAWLRVSTPLLYNVVILRTTAQAEALQAALKSTKEIGLLIKKLRVEGGFGMAMHTILNSAPNITDLFLTLCIWGSDNVRGLCSGLRLINPGRVIVVDAVPKKNKQVEQLFETLLKNIPKWDKLRTFDFPYSNMRPGETNLSAMRADKLASALAMSKSLETLIVTALQFPEYLRQVRDAPSLKAIHFRNSILSWGGRYTAEFFADIKHDSKLKALITHSSDTSLFGHREDTRNNSSQSSNTSSRSSPAPASPDHQNSRDYVRELVELKELADTRGNTVQNLNVFVNGASGPGSKKAPPAMNPILLVPFTSLTHLTWSINDERLMFSAPPPGYCALPNLQVLKIQAGSPSLLDIGPKLPLASLHKVDLPIFADVPASSAFLLCHGPKLVELSAPLEILIKVNVFDLCKNLKTVVVHAPHMYATAKIAPERKVFPENFLTCRTPHTALTKIDFYFRTLHSDHESPFKRNLEQLNPENFPVLKEIQLNCIKWPVSEQAVKKNKWIPLSEILRPKGIKLTDSNGIGGTGTKRRGA
ncbi:hypothetical protein DFH06DRAFT_1475870 [Mycena polygramma]|nr:hypothetical protein DFH06DRAFT_1475870 [Mycena polygramma]